MRISLGSLRNLRIALLTFLMSVLAIGMTGTASAVAPFNPPVTVRDPSCSFDSEYVKTATDSAGRVHGFSNLLGSDCNPDQEVYYVEGTSALHQSWTRSATGVRGFPVATAVDTTGTFLLYVSYPALSLRVVKRTNGGTVTSGVTLSTHVGPDGSLAQGDIAAFGGKFWAVWREHVLPSGQPGDEFDQTELFEANSFSGSPTRKRVTNTSQWDGAPTLAFQNGTSFPLTMVWTRGGSDFGDGGPTDLRIATRAATGGWTSKSFVTAGYHNFWPDLQVTAVGTYVAWNRDGATVLGTLKSGNLSVKTFKVPGPQHMPPKLSISTGTIAVAWVTDQYRILLAERVGNTWTSRYATGKSTTVHTLLGLSNFHGHSTVVIGRQSDRIFSVTEQ